ncbi:MAG TPA: YDG domain-containing protein, partial [Gaiellaceae bacterium]|nr:YDG domain-containing protein [Gaiellaceae bacterium]
DSKDFTIEKASSTTMVSCAAGPFAFDGTSQTPCSVHVTGAGGLDLAPAASYSNNVVAGTATASYTFAGDANHNGSDDSKSFTIDKASSTTVVTCPASVTYSGSAQTPCSVAVTGAGSLSLVPDPAYSNNTNAGTATASYTYGGDANHTDSSDSKNFTIDKAASHTAVTCPDSLIYDGSARRPCSVAVTGAGGLTLTPAANYSHNTDAGTATASYTYAGDANHDGSSDSKDFTIQKAASHTVVTCPASLIYDGSARTPCTVAVTGAGGLNLTPAASYSHNTDAGTATASYTYAGDTNHDGSSDSKNFAINKRNVTASISAADKTYDSTNAATITSCSIETQNGDHGIVSPDAVSCAGSNAHFGSQDAANGKLVTAEVSLTGAAQGNYQLTSPTASTTANISKRDVTASISASPKVYDGTDAATIATCSLDAQSGNHGAIAGDTVSCSGSNGHFNNKNVANGKPVTGDVALTGTAAGNYHLTSATAATTTNITKAPLVLKATDKTMLINGAVPTLTYTFTGFVNGETLATSDVGGSAACTIASGTVAGSFPITCAAGSLSSNNYSFSFSAGTLMVNYAGSCSGAPIGNPILQPVNNDGSSTFKQGSTVPLKFRACDANGASVGPTTAVPNIVMSFVLDHTTTGTPGVNETVDSTTPDTAFRWSSTDQQWIFNLSTKNLTNNKMYYYKVTLVGGASFMITFGLK